MDISNILGVNTIAEAVKDTASDARGFLGKICSPAAEEIGKLFQDKVKSWRQQNLINTLNKAEVKYNKLGIRGKVNTRIAYKIIEESSLCESDIIQEMWAGLLTSSSSENSEDESNLIFIDLLSRLSTAQCLILNYSCKIAKKSASKAGWIISDDEVLSSLEELEKITGISGDHHRIDRELDHLRSMELIMAGFYPDGIQANITPTPLALQLYVRSQGYIGSPLDYFGISHIKDITPFIPPSQ